MQAAMAAASLLVFALMLTQAVALSPADSQLVAETKKPTTTDESQRCLNTYVLSAHDLQIDTSDVGAGRHGTTRVRVKLAPNNLQTAMPVITASAKTGLVHNVLDSFRFLKNFALADSLVAAVNQQSGPGAPQLFPRSYLAARASSLLTGAPADSATPAPASVSRFIAAAEAVGKRELWADTVPHNMLLLIPGQGVGAVADIMSAVLDDSAAAPAVTLTLDVVHQPHMVNELAEHSPQSLDEHAHYHFFTPAGVEVDAARFLATLKAANNRVPALHIFAKGACRGGCPDVQCLDKAAGTPCDVRVPTSESTSNVYNGLCDGTSTSCILPDNCAPGDVVPGGACQWPANLTKEACAEGKCTNTTVNTGGTVTNTYTCVCQSKPECTTGEPCRAAAGSCDIPEVCTDGSCPPDAKKADYTLCPWVPRSHGRYGPYSVDLSSARASKVSAEEATARLSSAPTYLKEWPRCMGHCHDGLCALKWDHPACCHVDRASRYDAADAQPDAEGGADASTQSRLGHWEGPEWYCWD